MGGIGKTELALQYALKHLESETYPGGICWLQARQEVAAQIVEFAQSHLGLVLPENQELTATVRCQHQRWRTEKTLIVFDDVQDYRDIEAVLPPVRSQFQVLLTTRRNFGASVQTYEIKVLSEADSLELLRRLVQDQRVDQDLVTAKRVCEWLGYLPLGLELVGRYLARKKDVSIAKLWERLQSKRLQAKALLEAEPGMTASLGVTAAFELSWQDLTEDAKRLAALLSLFALAEIPWTVVQACLPEVEEEELEDWRDEQLLGLSLISRAGEGLYELHQLLREFFAVKRSQILDLDTTQQSLYSAITDEADRAKNKPTHSQLQETTIVIPHLQEAIEWYEVPGREEQLGVCLGWHSSTVHKGIMGRQNRCR
jgi:hypothetical protein